MHKKINFQNPMLGNRMKLRVNFLYFVFTLVLFSACSRQKYSHTYITANRSVPLAIQMPENKLVFANLSPLVYDELWEHFSRAGYRMVVDAKDAFSLRVTITDLVPMRKFLSADVLTYGARMKLTLWCQLFDFAGRLCAQKTFSFSTFVPRPRDHVNNDTFVEYEYRKLLQCSVAQIDHYFRPHVMKKRES